jgi:hypothetical protein
MNTPEIHRIIVTISRPLPSNPAGTVEEGNYRIEKGVIFLCDSAGNAIPREGQRVGRRRGEPAPLVRWERKLDPKGEDHRRAARELLMQRYNATKRHNDQHRPLIYPPSGLP